MPSSAHTRKRPYQPSIDSFFNRDSRPDSTGQRHAVHTSYTPSLPAEVQASLLSVGMRVRKSVPEGYKTDKTLGSNMSPIPSTAPPSTTNKTHRIQKSGAAPARELMPFCGLHKTGGWAVQGDPASSAPPALYGGDGYDEEDSDDMPDLSTSQSTLPGSQDSIDSPFRHPGSRNKRGYEEDMEDDLDTYFDNDGAMDSAMPIRLQSDRVMARMRHPKQAGTLGSRTSRPVQVVGGEDFDEAAFLVPDHMDLDGA